MALTRRSGASGDDANPNIVAIITQQLQNIIPHIVTQVTNNVNNANVNRNRNDSNGRNHEGCTYKEFLACKPKDFDGKGGVIVLTQWIKMEYVMDITTQPAQVKVAILKAGALTDEAISCGTLSKSSEKRKEVAKSSKQGGSWTDNKRAKLGKHFVEAVPTRNEYAVIHPRYVIEIANGKKVESNKIICGCKLELGDSMFNIDLIHFGHGGFDVIVGMDWLSRHKAKIVCHEKVVRIPLANGKVLLVQGERTEESPKSIKGTKLDEPKLGDILIVRDFPEVFLEDLSDITASTLQ
ncbi:putative reverse transcriptase domain-containing protein [Tanacetum coccineum]